MQVTVLFLYLTLVRYHTAYLAATIFREAAGVKGEVKSSPIPPMDSNLIWVCKSLWGARGHWAPSPKDLQMLDALEKGTFLEQVQLPC